MNTKPPTQTIGSAGRSHRGRWRRALTVVAAVAAIGAAVAILNAGVVSSAAAAPAGIHAVSQPDHPYLVALDVIVPDPHPSEDPSDYNDYSGGGAGAVGGSGGGGGGISFTDVLVAVAVIGGIVGLYKLRSNRS